ncbi:MbcA/ParS/Xre antitoxin family protein [Lichenicoccus sp.]|uniref:MbcA/ParS/Xre antitoxin family protein n=1 Tax=Lichenicoccus sp. TaxID=2781899 RepID=UPI003D0DE71F
MTASVAATRDDRDQGARSADITQQEAAAMLRASFNLFARWQLDSSQARRLLGSPSERTFQRWKAGEIATVPHDTVCRLADLMGIHKALRYMFAEAQRGYDWVRKPNAAFGGHSALDRMMQGAPADLAVLRAYLDSERAGW